VTVDVNIFDYASVSRATRRLEEYYADLIEKANELCRRLAEIGQVRAKLDFSNAQYDGTNDVTVGPVEPIDNGYAVRASGNAVLFIEFASGVIGAGHPEPEGYGPGTWSEGPQGKGHWQDPDGWYYRHGMKSIGNPPAAAMYHAKQDVSQEVQRIADEVFA
jgi:hypothetical protein